MLNMLCMDVKTPTRDNSVTYPKASFIERDKASWVNEYSDDIFQALKDSELNAKTVYFQSRQCDFYRPQMLNLLRLATEKHSLRRTTFHLATYLMDRFMDSYTVRLEKLNLTVISCLLLAAKIEEADMHLPKFSELCQLVPETYTVQEYRKLELKLLNNVNFELIRPTAATFGEYFLSRFITLGDYHNNNQCTQLYNFNDTSCYCCPGQTPWMSDSSLLLTWYNSYDDMVTQLSSWLMSILDVSLNYFKFANARPSIIASASIAAVRQMQSIKPVWTPYLINLTGYTEDIIAPFVDALVLLWKMYADTSQLPQQSCSAVLCDSPDSGIVSNNDTKSESSDLDCDEEHNGENANVMVLKQTVQENLDDNDGDDDEYCCYEYPLLPKRRRLL